MLFSHFIYSNGLGACVGEMKLTIHLDGKICAGGGEFVDWSKLGVTFSKWNGNIDLFLK